MSAQLKLSGDPRRPAEVRKYIAPKPAENPPGDFRLIAAMMFGMACMLLKIGGFGWFALALCLTYFANMSSREYSVQQIMSSCIFSLSGLLAAYMSALRPVQAS